MSNFFYKNHATSSIEELRDELDAREKTKYPYPLHVFHPKLFPFLENLTSPSGFDIPRSFVGTDLLTAYSTAIGTGYIVSTNGLDGIYMGIWGCKVGISSSGKSLSMNKVFAPLQEIQDEYDKEWSEITKGMSDIQLAQLNMPTLFFRDVHIPTLVRWIMPKNPKGMIKIADELKEWINGMNSMSKKEGTDEQFWLSSWNCTPYTAIRSGNQKFVNPRPFVNVTGGTQYKVLPDFFSKNRDTSGFVFRILFCQPEVDKIAEPNPTFLMPEEFEDIHTKSLKCMCKGITVDSTEDKPRIVIATIQASQLYNQWVKDQITKINAMEDLHDRDIFSSIFGKIKEYVLRFAGILVLSDKAIDGYKSTDVIFTDEEVLDSNYMKRAITLGHYYYGEAIEIYDRVQKAVIAPKEVMEFYNLWKTGRYSLGKIYKMVYPSIARCISDRASDQRGLRKLNKYLKDYPKIFGSNAK